MWFFMPLRLIYFVAIIEWFSTLAVEIIAMRLAIPVVGSSIILTSVFLGIVLLALSAGYYSGGLVADKYPPSRLVAILVWALLFAGVWYVVIAFGFERWMLEWMMSATDSYILTLFAVALALFFIPVFIASHTIPILTELLPDKSKGKAAGKMLFASTIWSFLGSVVTSIVLFELWWVHQTGVVVGVSLILLASIVLWQKNRVMSWVTLIGAFVLFGLYSMRGASSAQGFSYDSAYQNIRIFDAELRGEDVRIFSTNGALSSSIYTHEGDAETPFKYINSLLELSDEIQPSSILVIWAAGFTYPQYMANRSYTKGIDTVDIDPDVKELAEIYFLQEPLHEKITFTPLSARGAVRGFLSKGKTYDLIVIDAYNDKSVPEELLTQEFFQDILALQAPGGVMISNMILDSDLDSDFAQRWLATMSYIFDDLWTKNVSENGRVYGIDNFLVSTKKFPEFDSVDTEAEIIYSDVRHTSSIDSVKMLYAR